MRIILFAVLISISLVYALDDMVVFDLFEGNEIEEPFDHPVALQYDARILIAVVNWNGGIEIGTENSLWRASTHPNVLGHMSIRVSSQYRAKNLAMDQIYAMVQKAKETNDQNNELTHILLINQDIEFTLEDLDKLIGADKDFISGIVPSRYSPYYPTFIPMPTHEILGSKITVDQMYDKILSQTEPQQVLASGSEFLLIKLDALTSTKKIFSNKNEWFWLSEQTPRWAIGNCYDLITSKQSKTASKEPLTLQEIENYQSLKSQLRNLLQEEDLCFSTNNQRYG